MSDELLSHIIDELDALVKQMKEWGWDEDRK
jgi:hypothetical protein